jgi:hypothetical protein
LGTQRGVDGTTAAAHAGGTRVGQYQCNLVSLGGVPDFTAPRGQRVVSAGVQLQEAWAVGDGGVILRWNGINWAVFATTGTRLRAVSMDSYANGWTVGDLTGGVARILRWNPDGTPAWNVVGYPGIPNDELLNSVHALSENEAWAVGDDRGGGGNNTMILNFNGANWVYSDPGIDRDLNGVFMLDTNNDGVADDGWAVGERQGNNFAFMRWNIPTAGAWNEILLASGDREDLNSVFMLSNTDGWAVGETRNSRFTIVRWNNPTAGAWNVWSFANANFRDLNSIYMLSATDGWAVGDNGVVLRWNNPTAGAWNVAVAPNALTANDLFAVACATFNDCWAAGENGVMVHWDGASWAVHPQSGVVTGQDLRGIHIIGERRDPQAAWREIYQ